MQKKYVIYEILPTGRDEIKLSRQNINALTSDYGTQFLSREDALSWMEINSDKCKGKNLTILEHIYS
jgi:hypothetical protein